MAVAGVMSKFKISELSGVNRPAQKGARAVFMKRDDPMLDEFIKREFSDKERQALAESGHAMPDGSFPIQTEADLHNAIRAVGRAKNEAKAKAHIIARAKAMGSTGSLPEGWVTKDNGGSMSTTELKKSLGLSENATDTEVTNALIAKANKADEDKAKAEEAAKAATEKADRAVRKASMTQDEKDHTSGMSDDDADDFMKKSKAERAKIMAEKAAGDETFISKGVTIRKSAVGDETFAFLKAQAEENASLAAQFAKAEEERVNAVFEKRAAEELPYVTGTVEERAAMLKGVEAMTDPVAKKASLAALTTANALAKGAFSRIGARGGNGNGDGGTQAQIDGLAKEYQKTYPTVSFAKAVDAVMQENPGLYEKAEAERRERAKAAS